MGISLGKSKSKSSSSSGPWVEQQPFLTDVWDRAQSLFNRGTPSFYPGNMVAGVDPLQQLAYDLTKQRATGDMGLGDNMRGYINNLLGGDPIQWDKALNPAMQASTGIGEGMSGLASLAGGPLGDADAMAELRKTVMGEYLPGNKASNPFLDETYDRAAGKLSERFQEEVMPGLHAAFGGAGREYGGAHALASGKAAGELTGVLGDLSNQIYGGAYDNERTRQLQAAGELGDQTSAGQNRHLSALQSLLSGGVAGAGLAGDLLGRQQDARNTALGLAPGAVNTGYAPLDALFSAGRFMQDHGQREIDARRERHDYESGMGDWANMQRYAQIILGNLVNQSKSSGKSSGWNFGYTPVAG